jgi:glutathione S-transferase
MQLYIGNKNYSSWSLRPWLAMKTLGLPFEEVSVRFDSSATSHFKATMAQVSPAGQVPTLVDGAVAVWDSLAIVEYLAEKFPHKGVWPSDATRRARARSLCAEMHSGFTALRTACPMNIEASLPEVGLRLIAERADLRKDLERITAMWRIELSAHGGPFLFGDFSAADAFYAPVCSRMRTYALPLEEALQAYVARVLSLPAMAEWIAAAVAEHAYVAASEPYRAPPV